MKSAWATVRLQWGFAVAAALGLVMLAGLAHAQFLDEAPPTPYPAPHFTCDKWINSPPLTLEQLRGKVVLIDFWEYTCINCIRTFPSLRRWNRLYGPVGLVVIGVHTPEFDFAKDAARVTDAVKRFRFSFPIAVDSNATIWKAFQNQAWPAKYLIDRDGNVQFVHIGEGGYADLEEKIQRLLKQANPALNFSSAKYAIPADTAEFGGACRSPTPETYLGYARADRLVNENGYSPLTSVVYTAPREIPVDRFALDGSWLATPESVESPPSAGHDPSLTLNYRAQSVYLVAGSAQQGERRLYVTQDGGPVNQNARGGDVRSDSRGGTYLALGTKRMYYVIRNPGFESHKLTLTAPAPGEALYSFTFGNNCENPFDHR